MQDKTMIKTIFAQKSQSVANAVQEDQKGMLVLGATLYVMVTSITVAHMDLPRTLMSWML